MSTNFTRRDRTARLLRVAYLLHQHPQGIAPRDVARRVGMSVRTVYRDLRALEEEVGVPVWEQDGRYGTESGAFLPPLKLTLLEAVTLFLSARLMSRYADKRDPHVLGAFGKLATVLPAPIAEHVEATIGALADRHRDDTYTRVFDLLATAWAEGRRVRIWYPYVHHTGHTFVNERLVAPYFLEPNPGGHACYLIAHDGYSNSIRTFKVERIQQAELTDERFQVPPDFDVEARLGLAWGVADEDPVEVRLCFHDAAAVARLRESRWHPTQRERELPDGGLEVTFTVGGTREIAPWVLGWGDAVEVLDPPELRARLAQTAHRMAMRYGVSDDGVDVTA